MELFTIQQWDSKKKRWATLEYFKTKSAAEAKAATLKGKIRIGQVWRSTISI